MLMRSSRKRVAAQMLHRAQAFPIPGVRCLEVGCGRIGWLGELLTWGVRESDLSGIDIDERRLRDAQASLPAADLRVGEGTSLPWNSNTFGLVVASTVFSSILDREVRVLVAREIERVLAPGGALLWYDMRIDNPANPHVRGLTARRVRELFSGLDGHVKSVTLAPPVARIVAPRSWVLATLLEGLPPLRSHLLGVLVKPL
jgi:ubiquinone/menaquinone biosynthesis C-methylase UbiE